MERILLMVIKLIYKVPEWWFKICWYGKDDNFEKYSEEKRYALNDTGKSGGKSGCKMLWT